MQSKPKLYLESSVVCMYFQDSASYLRDLTRQFWEDELNNYFIHISEIVLGEIRATKNLRLRDLFENLVRDFEVLKATDDVFRLSNVYSSHRRMPRGDFLHIAMASISGVDFLVTWNLRHLHKVGTQELIKEINIDLKIPIPEIVTPADLLEEDI